MNRARVVALAVVAASSWAVGSQLRGGDIEVFCRTYVQCGPIGNVLAEIHERWSSYPVGGIPWRVHAISMGTSESVMPGSFGCPTAATAPGFESLVVASTVWNKASLPPSACGDPQQGTAASTFFLSVAPAIVTTTGMPGPNQPGTSVTDGFNTVSFFSDPGYFTPFGGSSVLAVTPVRYSSGIAPSPAAAGTLFTFDVLFNARSGDYSFVEVNAATPGLAGFTFASFPGATWTPPVRAYVDIVGTMTHEFGHAAGLGHSVIDSTASPSHSLFPTMFPYAQAQSFQSTVQFIDPATCAFGTPIGVNARSTVVGGIIGRSAATLEIDDVAALGREYPSATYASATGEITGTVYLGPTQVRGASVVAINAECPDITRVATLTYMVGSTSSIAQHRLSGLPPGKYYLYVERVDRQATDTNVPGYYLDWFDMPSYLFMPSTIFATYPVTYVSGFPNCTARDGGCANPTPFYTEFWDVSEGGEPYTQLADLIGVTAGSTQVRDFQIEAVGPAPTHLVLDVRQVGGPTYFSPRGLKIDTAIATVPTWQGNQVETRVRGRPGIDVGKPVVVFRSTDFLLQTFAGQLLQIPQFVTAIGVLDANAEFTFTATLQPSDVFRNTFQQAVIPEDDEAITALLDEIEAGGVDLTLNPILVDLGGVEEISNLVNVWAWTR
ncbi:MAG: hypothetical protein JNL94_12645 [Planctomycetes bacterium]|nr:hypothetical protein [Planctomycetota bacterium]